MKVAVLCLSVLVVAPAASQEIDLKPTLGVCESEIAAAPGEFDAYRCFDRMSRVPGGRAPAREFLERLAAREPGNTHARTMLSRLLDPRDPRVVELFGEVIERYASEGDRYTLGWATIYRSRVHMVNMRIDAADADAEAATALAVELDDYPLLAMCRFQQSRIASLVGDAGTLFGVLRSLVLDLRFDTLSAGFRAAVLQNLGSICGELGLRQIAVGYLQRAEGVALEYELQEWLFDVRHSMSSIAWAQCKEGGLDCAEALVIARSALEVAVGRGETAIGELRVAELTPGEEGLRMLRELASQGDSESFGGFEAPTALGLRLLQNDRAAEAIEPLEQALVSTRRGGFARNVVRGLVNLAHAKLELGPMDEAIETALRAIDAVERQHDIQIGETIGAMNFSVYSPIYYTTIGKLLGSDNRSFEDVALAMQISERLRSRFLIEHLDRAGGPAGADSQAAGERQGVLRKISELQTRLLLTETPQADRDVIERELERFEEQEALLRAVADRASPSRVVGREVTLEAIQRELRGDEALLSFLLSSTQSGGSWAILVTSTDARVYPLPTRRRLETAVEFWLGLLQRGDGEERAPAARLYRDLMAGALEHLPPGVRRLIIVPDGPLHRMPFDALRASADASPLIEEFEITHAPSAHVWLKLRGAEPSAVPGALILADPDFAGSTLDHAALRAFRLADRSIGRLPHARDEARRAVRSLGSGELRVGPDANEAFLKRTDLSGYRVLHFATHALIDEDRPDRSAILLAPGDDAEDGLLQAREVLDFELPGAMVTLSACQSTGGRVLAGEGVMGLARSFFQARASVVVGGLWPLRDEVTARLMTAFYDGLGRGLPAGEAMARAKREMHRDGFPPSAWAGVIVLGDGARVPWPDGNRARGIRSPLWIAGIALILVLLALRFRPVPRNSDSRGV